MTEIPPIPYYLTQIVSVQWHRSLARAGSQAGRGGLFIAIQQAELRNSAAKLMHFVCSCDSNSLSSKRFCGFGCERKAYARALPLPLQKTSG